MGTLVKICGITSLADAMTVATEGADMLGFMFYPQSKRHITIEAAREIHRRLPPFLQRVGVFVNPEEADVTRAISECGLSLLQFHGDEPSDFCTQFGIMSLKAFRVRSAESIRELGLYQTDAYLLDAYSSSGLGGTGEPFNWDLAQAAHQYRKPLFLAGGLTPENVGAAIAQVRPYAVDVSSGVESAPGKKDPALIRAFLQAVRRTSAPPAQADPTQCCAEPVKKRGA